MNPWSQPQKRVELLNHKQLVSADEQTIQTLKEFEDAPLVDIHYDLNDETDYAVFNGDGSVTRISECVTINGIQFFLVPGKNSIPKPVYEFLMQCPEQRRRVKSPEPNRFGNLGSIGRGV